MLRFALSLCVCLTATSSFAADECIQDRAGRLPEAQDRAVAAAIAQKLESAGLVRVRLERMPGEDPRKRRPSRDVPDAGAEPRMLFIDTLTEVNAEETWVARDANGRLHRVEVDVRPRYTETLRVCGCKEGGGGHPPPQYRYGVRLRDGDDAQLGEDRLLVVRPNQKKLIYTLGDCPARN